MSVALFDPPPSFLPIGLGPYRAEDYAELPDEPRCELILGRLYLAVFWTEVAEAL